MSISALIIDDEQLARDELRYLLDQVGGVDGVLDECAAAGFGFSIHRTDNPPEAALLALYTALAPQAGVRAAGGR